MTTNNHPANGPVSLDRLLQIREILSKASAQSDGVNLGYAMADAVKVIDGAIAARNAEPVAIVQPSDYVTAAELVGEEQTRKAVHELYEGALRIGDKLYRHPQEWQSKQMSCPKCNDTGMADSGGVQPWGEPILIECDCRDAMLQGAETVSNSDELPLDYRQGHKDGLEWAAQLAEANHPQTGDWLYDDPTELARAIRKGPDMPTVQAGNSPVTPDTWIPVSERMPYVGKKLALYGRRAKEDCAHYVDEGYLGSNGFFYFFDWEGGPRIDDCHNDDKATVTHWMYWELPAAPQQEVNRG